MESDEASGETAQVEEWQAVPTMDHPESGVDERYPCAPGPADGLTEAKAREISRGRNRAGEPSPVVTWHAESTGRTKPKEELFDVDRSRHTDAGRSGGESDAE